MKNRTLCIALAFCILVLAPLFAEDAAPAAADQQAAAGSSEEDIFGAEEAVTKTTEQTQNAAPRDEILKSAVPWITGTFTGKVGFNWGWSNIWGGGSDALIPTSSGLTQTSSYLSLGFVARPDKDINITGQIRTYYPFVKQITAVTGVTTTVDGDGDISSVTPITSTYTVSNLSLWSLYAKFNWNDALFFSFGKQSIKWGTGYFFSPADDIFAQSAVDITDPTAEREGPMGLRVQFPIPKTMDNLYFFAVLPSSTSLTTLASMKPEDIAVAAKAEFLFGNTEVALAGYYQREQRPQAILMGTTGFGNINLFGEGVAGFPTAGSDNYVVKTGSVYSSVSRSGDMVWSATAGAMYTNSDWNFTAVAQYLYNGYGYSSLSLMDLYAAFYPSGVISYADLISTLSGLGSIGQHYGVAYLAWTELWNTKWDFSILAIANFSDGSGYVQPTISYTCFTYVKLSVSPSFSWGGEGDEFVDPVGLAKALTTGNMADFSGKPTMSLSITASIGTASF